MAMITISGGTITKGTPATLILDKASVSALSKVVNDTFFSDTSHWTKITLFYKSATGGADGQKKYVEFDPSETTPMGTFISSIYANSQFNIELLMISDFDGGVLAIHRDELPTAELDLSLTEA